MEDSIQGTNKPGAVQGQSGCGHIKCSPGENGSPSASAYASVKQPILP